MPLCDDLKIPVSQQELSRRRFLGGMVGGTLAVAGIGTGLTTLEYLEPNILFEVESRFKVGRPEELAPGQVLFLPSRKLYLVHSSRGFYAMSATCTHLGCMTRWEPNADGIFCPCHGSRFARDGKVVAGPAPRPLPRLGLALEKGQLVVDTKQVVADDFLLKV